MRKLVVLVSVLVVVAGACSSSSKSTNASTATTATTAATGGTPTSGAATSGAPIKIAFLDVETGSFAAPDRHNALELAISQINAKGGIDGHMLQYTAYDTGILPQSTVTAVTKAISDKPTIIIGLQVSSGVAAAGQLLKQSGIPVLQEASDNTTDLSKLGVSNMFRLIPTAKMEGQDTVNYIASTHPASVGLWDDSDTNGVQVINNIQSELKAMGITNFVKRESPQGATDTTEAALAMKGVSILTTQGFPQTDALFVKQLNQNGVTAPNILTYGDNVIQADNLAPQAALEHDLQQANCDPDAVHSTAADAFTSAYKAKYGASITETATSGPYFYDAVYILAAAVAAAGGSLAPAALVSALKNVDYQGACGTYHADSENNLVHSTYILSFAGGHTTLVTRYDNMVSS